MRELAPKDYRSKASGADDGVAPNPDRPPRVLLRRLDQLGLAVVFGAALLVIGGYWLHQVVIHDRLIDIERAPPIDPNFRVDINTAEWPEIAQLPDIGESLARQVVAYRIAHGPFRDVGELRRVKGIGPKKLEAVRPFVSPIAPAPANERAVAKQEKAAQ